MSNLIPVGKTFSVEEGVEVPDKLNIVEKDGELYGEWPSPQVDAADYTGNSETLDAVSPWFNEAAGTATVETPEDPPLNDESRRHMAMDYRARIETPYNTVGEYLDQVDEIVFYLENGRAT